MFATSKRSFKAQFSMKVLLEVILLLIVYSQLYPALIEPYLQEFITPTGSSYSDPISAAILSLLPFIIAAVIVIGVVGFNMIGGRRR